MTTIASGLITGLYLFDVAEAIDLAKVPALVEGTEEVRVSFKPIAPSYLQFQPPPLALAGITIGVGTIEGFSVRLKIYDFGVIGVSLTAPFAGDWTELMARGRALIGDASIELRAEAAARALAERLARASTMPRAKFLSEDYAVFSVTELAPSLAADELLARHGDDIASLLRAEQQPLSQQERDEILRHRLSYFADDLVVPTWNAAFVRDSAAGVQAALDIFELANSQLLTFRYYDDLLDRELAGLYKNLKQPPKFAFGGNRRAVAAAHRVHALVVETNELTDKSENALKLVGDVYAARLYALTASRLGLDGWKKNVAEKLQTVDALYRFAVDQAQMSRANLLELTVVLILVLELVLFFVGIMK
jgi:hypothetical protein